MFFGLLTLLVALAISTVAAYYSIVGLMAIFAGAKLAIAIMGVVLEIGKLVVASWTFQNWKTSPVTIRSYFIVSVVVLMFITSLGIFGFLARAHIEQSSPTTLLEERIERIDLKIGQRNTQINRYQGRLDTLDQALQRYIELGAISKGLRKIGEMDNETSLLKTRIEGLESEIDGLADNKYELKNQLNLDYHSSHFCVRSSRSYVSNRCKYFIERLSKRKKDGYQNGYSYARLIRQRSDR